MTTFQWNRQWRDGQSLFHRELAWRGEWWMEWSKKHPELAAALWPRVLATLRRPDVRGVDDAMPLLFSAMQARTVEEFEKLVADLEANPVGS